jgi:hypothetical protein
MVWVAAVAMIVATAPVAKAAVCQGATATVRTYEGESYTAANLSLESFYTIGELKARPPERETFQSMISVSGSPTTPQAGGSEPKPYGGDQQKSEEKMLPGHSRIGQLTVVRNGVETAIPLERIRGMLFVRSPVQDSPLPLYISHYRYSVYVSLLAGQTVYGDYVNLGTTVLRGTSSAGRVEIPWEEVERVVCATR